MQFTKCALVKRRYQLSGAGKRLPSIMVGLAAIVIGLVATSRESEAANYVWSCTSGTWDIVGCWSPIGTPTSTDDVTLSTVSNADTLMTIDNTTLIPANANSLTIDATAGTTVTLQQSAGTLTVGQQTAIGGSEYIGYSGSGTSVFSQSGGTNSLDSSSNLFIGYNSGSNGIYNLSNTGTLSGYYNNSYEYVGYAGTGTFNQSGGTNSSAYLILGGNGGSGTYNLSAGSLGNYDTIVGGGFSGGVGVGTFKQSGGTYGLDMLILGSNAGSSGTYNLSNGSLSIGVGGEYIGEGGSGTFNQTGGTNTASSLYVDYGGAGTGTYNLSAGSLKAGLGEYIGSGVSGTFNQNGGSNTIDSGNILAVGYFGNGTYNLNSGLLSAGYEIVGETGSNVSASVGTFNQNGGTNTDSSDLQITADSVSTGAYNLNAGTLSVGGNIVGQGHGTLSIGSGTLTVGGGNGNIDVGTLVLGSISGSNVNFTLSSAGLYQGSNKVAATLTAGNITVGQNGAATFTQNGTAVTAGTTGAVIVAANAGSSGVYTLNSGTLNAGSVTVNSGGTFNFNGGLLSVGAFNGNLANNGGTLALGSTIVGTTNILGNYSQSKTSALDITLNGTQAGEYDTLDVFGTASLDGTLNISLLDPNSGFYTPQYGDKFDILVAAALDGKFSSVNSLFMPNGLAWQVSYVNTGSNEIVALTAVPLPPAFWLFSSGLIALLGFGGRREMIRQVSA